MASRKILVQEDFVHVSSGSNPAAGYLAFYPKSDNNFYLRTSAGVERRLLTSDDSFWTASGNNIYNANAGNVGIGTNNPVAKLDVNGESYLRNSAYIPKLGSSTLTSGRIAFDLGYYSIGAYQKRELRIPAPGTTSNDVIIGVFNVKVISATASWATKAMIEKTIYISINYTPTPSIYSQKSYVSDLRESSFIRISNFVYDFATNEIVLTIWWVSGSNRGYDISIEFFGKNASKFLNATVTSPITYTQGEEPAAEPVSIAPDSHFYIPNFVGIGVSNPTTQLHITGQFRSQLPTGTAPFVIASTTLNTNLNADLLDGQHASAFAPASHNHSFAGLSDVALVSPSAGHTLVYNGSAWVNNSQIRSMPGSEYNTIYIRSSESVGDFGDSEIYMTAEEGIYFRTNIGKATAAEASFDQYGIRSSKLMGAGERYLSADSSGIIKVATVQPTQYWERDAGNFNVSPINPADEVHAWLFKAGGVLVSDGYLETGRSGMYTVYNDMVVSEFYLSNNTFYYANSKLAFNNSTNLLTVDGGINAGSNLIAAGEVKLTKQTPGGVLRLQSHNAGPEFLRQYDYAGGVIFEVYNGSGYGGPAGIMARASEDHSASGYGTDIEIWNTANGGTNNRPVAIIRQDGIFKSGYGFAVGGDDGQSGTATIVTGCSYNSGTKTLVFTRASVTFSGGIVTSIASMSSLSVPLS